MSALDFINAIDEWLADYFLGFVLAVKHLWRGDIQLQRLATPVDYPAPGVRLLHVQDWSEAHPDHVSAAVLVKQLQFLLEQAPMIEAPTTLHRLQEMRYNNFAYIHPFTLAKASNGKAEPKGHICVFTPSPTKWVVTSIMPKDRVIFTPNPIPGIEKLL